MGADFSRVRLDPLLDYSAVELKQGGVLLDADVNEFAGVIDRRLRALASDVLGRGTVSATTPEAFRLTVVAGMLMIGRGRLYVDGLLAENHGAGALVFDPLMAETRGAAALRYDEQPYLDPVPPLPTAGRHLVYLDVWQREVTHLEEPELVETAVGVETSSRVQTVWQVRVLDRMAGRTATCESPDSEFPDYAAITAPSDGRLTTGTFEVPPLDDPCELPPTGGYRGLENQLYRVEIHDPGLPGADAAGGRATFKWSRENASVGSRVTSIQSANELELESLGRDEVLGIADGDWVEITDDQREFAQVAGEMRRISVDVATRRISFAAALPGSMLPAVFPDSALAQQRNLRVRRWDHGGPVFRIAANGTTVQVQDLDAPASAGVIDVPAAGTTLLLEHGLTVSFSSGARGFKAGDWWTFAARTADASVEPLTEAPPRGIHHHYTRLGIWDVPAAAVTDCRTLWPPRGEGHDCSCTACVTPESHASGEFTIQAAVDRLRSTGGSVCLAAGSYALGDTVRVAGARSVAIRGQGSATLISAPGTAFAFESSIAVALEKLAIISVGQQTAVTVRTVAGLALRELAIVVLGGNDARSAAIGLAGVVAGAAIRGNVIIAPEGIRAEPLGRTDDEPVAFTLTATVTIEDNILWCQRRGVSLAGSTTHLLAHFFVHRIVGNEVLGCRETALAALGVALPGASMQIARNSLNVNGSGIACGVDGAWIEGNKLNATREGQRAQVGHAIALATGLDPNGSDQAQVLANQVRGFAGAGIAILAPVQELIAKLNIIEDCALGILMSDDADAGAVSIENNHLTDINGSGDQVTQVGMAVGIAVMRTASATVAGNTIRRVSSAAVRTPLTAGLLMVGVLRARIHGNEIVQIGPTGEFTGEVAGIMVRAPYTQVELAQNHVERDAQQIAAPGASAWIAAAVLDNLGVRSVGGIASNEFTAVARAGGVSTVRVDDRRVLVLGTARPFVSAVAPSTAVNDAAAAAVAARGSAASLQANTFVARGRGPAVQVLATGEALVSDNRCELNGRSAPALRLSSPVVVLSSNRVRGGEVSVAVTNASKRVAAVGNVTTGGISVGAGPLPAPWNALNITG